MVLVQMINNRYQEMLQSEKTTGRWWW
jgi:hypothetical protein